MDRDASPDVVNIDHLAVAIDDAATLWSRYRDQLGGRWVEIAGLANGFEFAQVGFAGGMKIEVLNPYQWEQNDFLKRFLDHTGPGPHHITFKVPDLTDMLDRCDAMGYRTVGVDRSNPGWQEAFLHPKDGAGVVIQLAQQGYTEGGPPDHVPDHWTGDPSTPQSTMDYIGHSVTEFDSHLRRFVDLLDGTVESSGSDELFDAVTTDVVWPNGGRVRLLKPRTSTSPLHAWLGERPARIHHVSFSNVDQLTGTATVLEPEASWGLRLVLNRS